MQKNTTFNIKDFIGVRITESNKHRVYGLNGIGLIYKITNPNGKVYIGQTRNISRRLNEYKNDKRTSQPLIHKSIRKYGLENHELLLLDEVSTEKLNDAEQFYIALFNSFRDNNPLGLNLTIGGNCDTERSEETKRKIGLASRGNKYNLGRKQSQEVVDNRTAKVRESYKNGRVSNLKGRVVTQDDRDRISRQVKERWSDPEYKKRVSEKLKGRIVDDETRKKISSGLAGNKNRLGSSPSEETRKKLSESHKGIKRTQETIDKWRASKKNYVCSEETRQKLRDSSTGRKHTKESLIKMSESQKGKKLTDAHKQKIADLWKSPEFRAKVSATKKANMQKKNHKDE